MHSEARKIHLIEEVLKVKNEAVLIELEAVLKRNAPANQTSVVAGTKVKKPSDFVGILSQKNAQAMLADIEQSRDEWERGI
jgi:hypothetical protein